MNSVYQISFREFSVLLETCSRALVFCLHEVIISTINSRPIFLNFCMFSFALRTVLPVNMLSSAELVSNQRQQEHFSGVLHINILDKASFMNCA